MDENKLRFGVGVLVIAAIGIGIILTFLFGAFPTVLNREYTMQVWFPSAAGVSTNTPVFRDGVRIGRVSGIVLKDDAKGGVVLTLRMDESHVLTRHYAPRISNGSLITGDSKLEFVREEYDTLVELLDGNVDLILQPYGDGDFCEYGRKVPDPFSVIFDMEDEIRSTMDSIREAGQSIEGAGNSVKGLVGDLRTVIGVAPSAPDQDGSVGRPPRMAPSNAYSRSYAPPFHQPSNIRLAALNQAQPLDGNRLAPRDQATIRELTGEAIRTLEEFQGAIRDVRSLVSDPAIRRDLKSSIEKVPDFIDEATTTLDQVGETFESFQEVGKQFEQVGVTANGTIENVDKAIREAVAKISETLENLQGTFENVEKFTEPLGDRGPELVEQVLRTLSVLDGAVQEFEGVGRMINSSDGTVRRLFEDDQLYYDVLRTVENIEMASAKLRPILDDVRVFSDKIARDPRQLGVRGAINNRPNGLGFK